MAELSFGFSEDCLLQLNDQKKKTSLLVEDLTVSGKGLEMEQN